MADFEELYKKYYPIVFRFTLSFCRDPVLAEEITQETFVKALEHLERFDGRCQLYVWLCQIAKNTYYSHLRKQRRLVSEDAEHFELTCDPEEKALDKDMAHRIYALLDSLPEPYQEVFSLRVFGELPFSQIGAIYGKTDSLARLIYYRAKKQIKEDLDE